MSPPPSQVCLSTSRASISSIGGCQSFVMKLLLFICLLPAVTAFTKIYMGHATYKPEYDYVCHEHSVTNTLGGQIDSRKEHFEEPLKDCDILLVSPQRTLIDFRFTSISIIASNAYTCADANLNIYDGATTESSLLAAFPNGICGQTIPTFPIRSTGNTMLIKLQVTAPYTSSFSAVYTAFSPRTSVLCFYCGDLCLQDLQLCDGLMNCWHGEDEQNCATKPPPDDQEADNRIENFELILLIILSGVVILTLGVIIALLVKQKTKLPCRGQRRRPEPLAMMHPPLTPHMMAERTTSVNSTETGIPLNVGFNMPFIAGPEVGVVSCTPRSDLPPPYSTLPQTNERVLEDEAHVGSRLEDNTASSPEDHNLNDARLDGAVTHGHRGEGVEVNHNYNDAVLDEAATHISKDEDMKACTSLSTTADKINISPSSTGGAEIHDTHVDETSSVDDQGPLYSQDGSAVDSVVMDVVPPEMDNSVVNVSSRDTIYVIPQLQADAGNIYRDDDGREMYV